jgi:hypothetical protein
MHPKRSTQLPLTTTALLLVLSGTTLTGCLVPNENYRPKELTSCTSLWQHQNGMNCLASGLTKLVVNDELQTATTPDNTGTWYSDGSMSIGIVVEGGNPAQELLLEATADRNGQTQKGRFPIHHGIWSSYQDPDLFSIRLVPGQVAMPYRLFVGGTFQGNTLPGIVCKLDNQGVCDLRQQ